MKKLKLILFCLIIGLTGCNGSAWLYGDNDAVGTRLGVEITENVEAGVLSYWYPYDDADSQIWGVYSLYHFPDLLEVPNPFGDEPETIKATGYIGGQTSMDSNYEDYISPLTGIIFQEVLFIEYQYDAFDNKDAMEKHKFVGGLIFRF